VATGEGDAGDGGDEQDGERGKVGRGELAHPDDDSRRAER
jgi:hypothetical protein